VARGGVFLYTFLTLSTFLSDAIREKSMTRCTRCFGDLLDLAVFCPHCGQPHEPDLNQLLDRSLDGRYHLYRRLGEGGLSTVFAATDIRSDQIVVVKISDPRHLAHRELTQSFDAAEARRYWAEMIERMRRKAVALAAIEHPHIVRILDTNPITEELRYVVMEFLRGQTLREEIDAQGRLSAADTVRIGLEICAGLDAIHTRGIVHRDLNPRNIFLCEAAEEGGVPASPRLSLSASSVVKVIDFGIAKIPQPPGAPPFTQHAVMSGTVAYASPEQCQNRALDHRADIYSVGVVLYEMVTGERPFNGRTPTEIALQQLQAEPLAPRALVPELPPSLEAAILRALAKDSQARQQSIEELAAELRAASRRVVVPLGQGAEAACALLSADEISATPTVDEEESQESDEAESAARLKRARARRRRVALAAAALVLAVTAAGLMLARHGLLPLRPITEKNLTASSAQPPAASASPALETAEQAPLDEMMPHFPTDEADALEIAASISTLEPGPSFAPPTTSSLRVPSITKTAPPSARQPSFIPQPPVRPQASSTPAPMIAARREPPPVSEPEWERGPVSAPAISTRPREANPARVEEETEPASEPRRDERESERPRDARPETRRAPLPRSEAGDDILAAPGAEREPENSVPVIDSAPKVISWSGTVNREREVTLEVPGVPGTVSVPDRYRKRVGVVEPPGPQNRWRCVVLRVFGKGPVSIIVRWWPHTSGMARQDARRQLQSISSQNVQKKSILAVQ
jgi:serine/threonine protein kinase